MNSFKNFAFWPSNFILLLFYPFKTIKLCKIFLLNKRIESKQKSFNSFLLITSFLISSKDELLKWKLIFYKITWPHHPNSMPGHHYCLTNFSLVPSEQIDQTKWIKIDWIWRTKELFPMKIFEVDAQGDVFHLSFGNSHPHPMYYFLFVYSSLLMMSHWNWLHLKVFLMENL